MKASILVLTAAFGAVASGCGSSNGKGAGGATGGTPGGAGGTGTGGGGGVSVDAGTRRCDADPSHAWQPVTSPTKGRLVAVHGSGTSDVWAVGDDVIRWDGASWSMVALEPIQTQRAYSVWVAAPNSPVVGQWDGSVQRLVSGAWQRTQLSTDGPGALTQPIGALWGSGAELWAAEGGSSGGRIHAYHNDGTSWSAAGTQPPGNSGETALWGSSTTDVWLVGDFLLGGLPDWMAHSSGGDFAPIDLGDTPHYRGFRSIWGSGPADVWVVGGPLHWNGSVWQPVPGVDRGVAVWGSSPDDVMILNEGGGLSRWDGTTWCNEALPTDRKLVAIWGAGPADVWAVGDEGTILHLGPR